MKRLIRVGKQIIAYIEKADAADLEQFVVVLEERRKNLKRWRNQEEDVAKCLQILTVELLLERWADLTRKEIRGRRALRGATKPRRADEMITGVVKAIMSKKLQIDALFTIVRGEAVPPRKA
jgi:hypothetical protein